VIMETVSLDDVNTFDRSGNMVPAWPVINVAKPVQYKLSSVKTPSKSAHNTTIVLPDTQFGYRDIDNMLHPFHDAQALDASLAIVMAVRPDHVVILGDFLDLPTHSKYTQEPSFARTTQEAIDAGYDYLARLKAVCDHVVVLSGNHDARLAKHTMINAAASFGLKRSADVSDWPVLSPQYLLNIDKLGVEWLDGYPAAMYKINDQLVCIHGEAYGATPSIIATKVWKEYPWYSVIHGHTHSNYVTHRTVDDSTGPRLQMVGSPGCLCRIDGNVPSHKSGVDAAGRPVSRIVNWQQGLFVVSHTDNWFNIENVLIQNGTAWFRGKQWSL
jgi:predicted phosphodiesterase